MLATAFLLLPVGAGVLGTLAPAFGVLPAAGVMQPGLGAFADLAAWPGLPDAVRLSLVAGGVSTLLSLAVVTAVLAAWSGTRTFAAVRALLSPLLSVPHAAAAFGLAFLIAPSGWILRALSPWATGFDRPPDWLIVQDPWGLTLIAGLVAKEVPFVMLMALAALGQADAGRAMTVARSLGYGRMTAWVKVVFPQVYRQIRLPVYVVLAFSMTVVDVAIVLGPNTPPSLAVQAVKWMGDPDLAMRLRAAAAAVLQLALVLGALAAWWLGERAVAALGRRWIAAGGRGRREVWARRAALGIAGLSAAAVLGGLAVLALWSVAGFWAFPDPWPSGLTMQNWTRHAMTLNATVAETAVIAAVSTLIALTLAIGCLEAEMRHGLRLGAAGLWLLYLPLLVPQVAFLPGLSTAMLLAGVQGGTAAVTAAHVLFVFPYVFLALGDPWRAWDRRYGTVASALGAGPDRVLWSVRLPMLLAPLLTAAAVGVSVSVGQYLPTLLIGGGRVQTLTTDAVALASGGDRRAIGVFALAQTAAALVPFALAIGLPRLIYARRGGMRHG
ncbi:ABC transporter permease subunit [Rhodobacteraceae bacterium CCMM004]|nr:ABC transporter permease subunit [Rhodobacteraceae bacterium CCMM004]